MKIYTRTGDDLTTGVYGGGREWKGADRFSALGDLDELNASLGWVAVVAEGDIQNRLQQVQNLLFDIGAEIASDPGDRAFLANPAPTTQALESEMDAMTELLPPLKTFILPGGCELASRLHIARTVCRRAERSLAHLDTEHPVRGETRAFINRLSDWLFVAARTANQFAGVSDVIWKKSEEN